MSNKVPYGELFPIIRLLAANRNGSSATGKLGVESFKDHPWDYAIWRYALASMGERPGRSQRAYQGRVCDADLVLGHV